jgi:hypothetical protein
MGDLIAASTTDPLSVVRETVGLSPVPSEEEKREAEQMQAERRENGHRRDPEESPKYQRRIDKIVAQKSEAERRAEAAEWERDELRQRLAEIESNAPLDRALAAEYRAAELEERLRSYEHGTNGYANAPPASADEQPLDETPANEAPPAEQPPAQQQANEAIPPEHQAFVAFQEHHNQKLTNILSQRSDANELVARAAPIIQSMREDVSQAISYALQNSPNSEHVMIHLMQNPDLLRQANALSPQDAFAATLRLAGRLEAANGQPRTVPVSHAPPPIRPLSGNARSTVDKDPGDMSLGEYRAWYDRNYGKGRR